MLQINTMQMEDTRDLYILLDGFTRENKVNRSMMIVVSVNKSGKSQLKPQTNSVQIHLDK